MQHRLFKKKIVLHLREFLNDCGWRPPDGIAYFGVSGGVDSMVMVYLMRELLEGLQFNSQKIKLIHFDHGWTDHASQTASELVQHFQVRSLAVEVVKLSKKCINDEFQSRIERNLWIKNKVAPRDHFYQGHHIDDSFEWYLMQQFKSSSSVIGIPVNRSYFWRPLMAFSKRQIQGIAARFAIPFWHDPTNKDTRFERNYLRHHLIPAIAARYPRYLRHYVSRFQNTPAVQPSLVKVEDWWFRDSSGFWILKDPTFRASLREEIIMALGKKLSTKNRGKWRRTLQLLLPKIHQKEYMGPCSLTGEVELLVAKGVVGMIEKKHFAQAVGHIMRQEVIESEIPVGFSKKVIGNYFLKVQRKRG